MKKLTTVLIGAGLRGKIYTDYALENPDELCVVGVAEPSETRRNAIAELHGIADENIFTSWEDVFKRERFADVAIICTQDREHFLPAMAAVDAGYDILLEKPISPNAEECSALAKAAEEKGVKVVICHVLRYSPFFSTIKEIIDSGEIGDVVSVVHCENVGDVHHAHSFVRGNWRNSKESSPMILAKSCHDTDIIQWLIGKKCKKVSSFGSLKHFKKENCPEGAPLRCLDGCKHAAECPYDARKVYLQDCAGKGEWFRNAVSGKINPTDEELEAALRTGPYGRCVYQCDNDVVDHQVVNMEFEDGVTAMFSMCSFTLETYRTITVMGTKGQIDGDMLRNTISVSEFLSREQRQVPLETVSGTDGHGGGDTRLMKAFCQYVGGTYQGNSITEVGISAHNHLISMAAEESRVNGGKIVEL